MSTRLLRGGTVIDGTGAPAYRADVLVEDGKILRIGADLPVDDASVLDCSETFVTPGFVDNHTHFDPSLFWDPLCDPMPQHGVTTVVTGNCSLSLAPLRARDRSSIVRVFGFIEDIPKEAFDAGVPWSWESYDEYAALLGGRSFGVNIAQLVGHSPMRMYVMGEDAWDRVATDEEIAELVATLEACMDRGAFGLSTSFFDTDPDGRPVPSVLADDREFAALCDVLARRSAMLEFIPSLNGPAPMADIDRIAALCGPRGVRSTFNGVFDWPSDPEKGWRFVERCAQLQADGAIVLPQISPRTLDMRINWDNSLLFMRLTASWGKAIQARGEAKRAMLLDPEFRRVAREEWDAKLTGTTSVLGQPHMLRFVSVTRPENEPWVGKTLADWAASRDQHVSDGLADWVLANDLNPGVIGVGVANANADQVAAMLVHPATILGNSDAGAHVQMMCAAGDSTLLLTRHVRDRGDLSLEDAVHALTGQQAELLGMRRRGTLTEGHIADVTVFDLDELVWGEDDFVQDLPGGGMRLRRPAGGYRYTLVDGEVVQEDGKTTGQLPGRLISV
jgi:N-acyl-D-aspartate/D-glutamate deacylase